MNVSKIRLAEQEFDIKDEKLRHDIDVLLGRVLNPPESDNDIQDTIIDKSN